MENTQPLPNLLIEQRMADAWSDLLKFPADATVLRANAHRLAFADPEFMARRETRGIRIQLELLKPDVDQQEQGITDIVTGRSQGG